MKTAEQIAVKITMRMTPWQARIVWGLLDGACDAGACDGGLSEEENEAARIVITALGKAINP